MEAFDRKDAWYRSHRLVVSSKSVEMKDKVNISLSWNEFLWKCGENLEMRYMKQKVIERMMTDFNKVANQIYILSTWSTIKCASPLTYRCCEE